TFSPYLSKAAQYAIVDRYLFQQKTSALNLALINQHQSQWSVEDHLLAKDLENDFDQLLSRMSPTMQQVFILSRTEGLSITEIAQPLRLSEQNVKNYIASVLQIFRTHLKSRTLSYFLAYMAAFLWS